VHHPSYLNPISRLTHPWTRRWLGWRNYWLAQAVGWGGFFLLAIQDLLSPNRSRTETLLEPLFIALLGIVTTHALRVILLHFRRQNLSWGQLAWRLALCWVAASAALGGSLSLLSVGWLYAPELQAGQLVKTDGWEEYLDMVTRSLFFIGLWISLYFGYLYYRQMHENNEERLLLANQVREAELRALKAQLNPHFLFNSLNTIRAMIPRDLPNPRLAVTALSELLRAALRLGGRPLIPLSEELQIVENYLALESMRHEQRLRTTRRIAPDSLNWLIPPFTLQTLVENAINHGIARLPEGGEVAIETRLSASLLELSVTNPGSLRAGSPSNGMGLQNIREQIVLMYGPNARLDLFEGDGQVTALLTLPPAPTGPELAR
jgi:two-component system, LytTR family, sensor kinase